MPSTVSSPRHPGSALRAPRARRRWRVFYTKPRAEKKAAERLAGAGVEVFLPLRTVVRQWSDRKQRVEEPLFRGYLFARVDERERLDVLEDASVVRSVAFGRRLAEVRDEEIARLEALQAVPERLEAVTLEAFPEGSEVIVTNGPLKGVRGYVSDHPKPLFLVVQVESIAQAVRVHVPADWVMRLTPGAAS